MFNGKKYKKNNHVIYYVKHGFTGGTVLEHTLDSFILSFKKNNTYFLLPRPFLFWLFFPTALIQIFQ